MADICGRPMIWWVYNQVSKVEGVDSIYVGTDDSKIAAVCERLGLDYQMTSADHGTSTERVHEISKRVSSDVVVCVNGDEPLVSPAAIAAVIPKDMDGFFAANIMTKITNPVEAVDSTNIKVVVDVDGYALFMSRLPIPYPKASLDYEYYKHVGILAYSPAALDFFVGAPRMRCERAEDINEIRFIEHGKKLKMTVFDTETLSVDTPKDLEKVRTIIRSRLDAGELSL